MLELSNRLGAQKNNTIYYTVFWRDIFQWDTLIYTPELRREELIAMNSSIT